MHKLFILIFFGLSLYGQAQDGRARDYGLKIGILATGKYNAITDVPGVTVGHHTLVEGSNVRTGVTAILPHNNNIFQNKVPAAIFIGNGFGKLTGYSQVEELGNLETPIILTNTLSVPTAANALINYTLNQEGNEDVRSVNAVVGETNDGFLNDIRGLHIKEAHILSAIEKTKSGKVEEGNIGAGTGTICFGFKGGIGTSSRKLPDNLGGYTLGVLVQTNFGGVLTIDGIPVAEELGNYPYKSSIENSDGSCMIIVATDAPLDARNLKRLAKRAFLGIGRTGGIVSNGSGDYVIAFSSNEYLRIPYKANTNIQSVRLLRNEAVTPLFLSAIEATEKAIINSLLAAKTMTGLENRTVNELPKEVLRQLIRKYKMSEN